MHILGIETSCDDTGIAVLEVSRGKTPRFHMLSNVVASQIKVHQKYGGVYPMLAKREHQKNLPIALKKAQKEARIEKTKAIAITYGPGLAPCLWTGLNFAKELAKEWGVPLIPVDHIEGHLLVGLLEQTNEISNFQFPIFKQTFPAVGLIVSGGHTQLLLVKNIGSYKMIGETRDDAAGECFDKTARILGLPYPGGPAIAREAAQWQGQFPISLPPGDLPKEDKPQSNSNSRISKTIKLPRPMLHTKDYDFSFSGLKTAVFYDYQARPKKERESKAYIQAMAAEIQQAINDVLVFKTLKAAKAFQAKSIILGGGVSANDELRRMFEASLQTVGLRLLAPPKNLSTDNGAMIALAGYFNFVAGKAIKSWDKLEACPNLRIA